MAAIELCGVTKTFRSPGNVPVEAVHNLDLQICNREFVVLLGPSGCGKTTILRLIAGLEEADGGEIRIGGQVVNHVPAKERNIAMVFQNHALYPHMSAYENMAFGLRLRGLPHEEVQQRVSSAAGILGITDILDRKPGTLSGGQCQRVALGRAIVRQPKAFLFDEPLSNLDAKLRSQMRAELLKLHERLQSTMIYVTHDQSEAMAMGQRIAIVHQGKLQQYATPLETYRRPANVFVASFLGSPSINLLHGTLRPIRDQVFFLASNCDGLRLPLPDFPNAHRWLDRQLLLGIRPEDCAPLPTGKAPGPNSFIGCLEAAELHGADSLLYITLGQSTLVCRTRDELDRREVGHRMHFEVIPERLLLFDEATTQRIFPE